MPKIYAAFAVSLHRRYGFGFDRIATVLADTQEYWNGDINGEFDILRACEDETGINILSQITARECGVKGDKTI